VHVNCLLLAHVSTPVVSSLDLPYTRKIFARSDAPSLRLQYRPLLVLDACLLVLLQTSLVSGDVASFALLAVPSRSSALTAHLTPSSCCIPVRSRQRAYPGCCFPKGGRSSNLGQGSEVKAAHSSNKFSVLDICVFYYVLVSELQQGENSGSNVPLTRAQSS
jgi:hypothetical protein